MNSITLKDLREMEAPIDMRCMFFKRFENNEVSIKELIRWLRTKNSNDYALFELWLISENPHLAKSALENGADVNLGSGRALIDAVKEENEKIVKVLLENGANPNVRKGLPLKEAVESGNLEIVELLIGAGAKHDIYEDRAMKIASKRGYYKIVEFFLKRFNYTR